MVQNKGLIFADYPTGFPQIGKDLKIETREFDVDQQPPAGGITAKVHYVSYDPYQRGRMRKPEFKSYVPSFELGQPVTNAAIVSVIKSDNPKFKPGDILCGPALCTEEYSAVVKEKADACHPLDNPYNLDVKQFLGALGLAGLTAYSSFFEIGEPKKGEAIFVSSAFGAVGQIVGQLAKHEGLKVYGSVGDDKKLAYLTEKLGFDGGFNYKKEKPLDALKRLVPDGIDIYYDNVGGEQLEASITHMKDFGRIVACGMISQYNVTPETAYGIKNLNLIVTRRIRMQGFIVIDKNMGPKYHAEHQRNLQKWIHDGTFKTEMSVTHGIDNAAEGLLGMFEGKNFGKALLEVSPL